MHIEITHLKTLNLVRVFLQVSAVYFSSQFTAHVRYILHIHRVRMLDRLSIVVLKKSNRNTSSNNNTAYGDAKTIFFK